MLIAEHDGQDAHPFDQVLVAVGRVANTRGYGLEELASPPHPPARWKSTNICKPSTPTSTPPATWPDRSSSPTPPPIAWYAAVNALFDPLKKFKADYSVIPWSTFVDPEVARVGLNEQEAKARSIPTRSRFTASTI